MQFGKRSATNGARFKGNERKNNKCNCFIIYKNLDEKLLERIKWRNLAEVTIITSIGSLLEKNHGGTRYMKRNE